MRPDSFCNFVLVQASGYMQVVAMAPETPEKMTFFHSGTCSVSFKTCDAEWTGDRDGSWRGEDRG